MARVAPFDVESQLTVARAALDAHDLAAARTALAPLLRGDMGASRPTARACLLMAEIEEADGAEGAVREWLNRAARAPRDRAWVADGVITDHWSPVSPSGVLDAFAWRTPDERLSAPEPAAPPAAPPRIEPAPPIEAPVAAIEAPPEPVKAIESPPPASAPPPAPSPETPRTPRANGNIVLLPSNAPDDPGPHGTPDRKPGYRLFANE